MNQHGYDYKCGCEYCVIHERKLKNNIKKEKFSAEKERVKRREREKKN